jgi:hypothetical protein
MSNNPRFLKDIKSLPKGKLCPQCYGQVGDSNAELVNHFQTVHKRNPTKGEIHRFRLFSRKELSGKGYTVGIKKDWREINGGLPSLGKRR